MEMGVGLDATLNLTWDEQARVAQEAARLGYTSIWTNETAGHDGFQVCVHRWAASKATIERGLTTGIAVSPVYLRTPLALAMSAGTTSELTGGRFILGIGSGSIYRAAIRRSLGLPQLATLSLMKDYLTILRDLLGGKNVTYEGKALALQGVRLALQPSPNTPIYLGALGPKMLRMAGELADGAVLNWCTPEQVSWSRGQISEGAARAERDPFNVKVVEYIRVCIDEDIDLARHSLARSVIPYALSPRGATEGERGLGYRAHFERMGFGKELSNLERMRDGGAPSEKVADAFPPDLLQKVGYYGSSAGAAKALKKLAEGLDVAIVRVVAARPGVSSVLSALHACGPVS